MEGTERACGASSTVTHGHDPTQRRMCSGRVPIRDRVRGACLRQSREPVAEAAPAAAAGSPRHRRTASRTPARGRRQRSCRARAVPQCRARHRRRGGCGTRTRLTLGGRRCGGGGSARCSCPMPRHTRCGLLLSPAQRPLGLDDLVLCFRARPCNGLRSCSLSLRRCARCCIPLGAFKQAWHMHLSASRGGPS